MNIIIAAFLTGMKWLLVVAAFVLGISVGMLVFFGVIFAIAFLYGFVSEAWKYWRTW